MPRKTVQNDITSPELIAQINPKNKQLIKDYLMYLKSIQRSEATINCYKNDLEIFFVWCLKNINNKFFAEITKRDIISYQNFLLYDNQNSPARVRRLKATLSSLSNYIETILDDDEEFKDFRNIIKKVENPINQPVREKTILEIEDIQKLLDYLVEHKKYQQACFVALATFSGRRKSELVRFKLDYFVDDNIIFGSLYKTPEKIKTKGRGNGKMLNCYVLCKQFKPYLDLWIKQREELGINNEWLFVTKDKEGNWQQMKAQTANSWAISFGKILNCDFYIHMLRHFFTTYLSKSGIPDNIIQEIIGWDDSSMVKIYNDETTDNQLSQYFDENGIKSNTKKSLSDL